MAVKDTGMSVIFTRTIPGATDRSAGVHVAEPGVPGPVIGRAKALLEDLVRREAAREPGNGPRRVRHTQMLLPVESDHARPPGTAGAGLAPGPSLTG